jgi:hypothetical protein
MRVLEPIEIFEKTAARAGLKQLRNLITTGANPQLIATLKDQIKQTVARGGQGAHEAAAALKNQLQNVSREFNPHTNSNVAPLVQQATMGRNLPRGSQISTLGSGSEGVAQLIADPKRQGVSVLKTHDPTAMGFNQHLINNKDKLIGHEIPNVATTYEKVAPGAKVMGHNAPQYISEYVPGKTMTEQQFSRKQPALSQNINQNVQKIVPGMELTDLNQTNFKMTPQGPKAIDYMAVDQQHMLPAHQRRRANYVHENIDMASPTGQGFNPNSSQSVARQIMPKEVQEQVIQHAIAGNPLAEKTLNTAQNRYQGAVLNQAYGGNRPIQALQPAPHLAQPIPVQQTPQQMAGTVVQKPVRSAALPNTQVQTAHPYANTQINPLAHAQIL